MLSASNLKIILNFSIFLPTLIYVHEKNFTLLFIHSLPYVPKTKLIIYHKINKKCSITDSLLKRVLVSLLNSIFPSPNPKYSF